jgi:hypothetical protein
MLVNRETLNTKVMTLVDTPAAAVDTEAVKVADQEVVNLALQGEGSHGAFT